MNHYRQSWVVRSVLRDLRYTFFHSNGCDGNIGKDMSIGIEIQSGEISRGGIFGEIAKGTESCENYGNFFTARNCLARKSSNRKN